MPLLEEAIEFIEMLVSDSAGFKAGPGDDADDWKFIRGKIVGDDGSVNYAGIEMVSGHHFQHVANDALQRDMFDAVVNDSTVHPATRCTGVGDASKCIYHRSMLPECPPCTIGKAKPPRTLSLFEHYNGTHWDGCNYGGWLATGHASLNTTSRTLPAPSAPRQGSWR